MSVCHGNGEDHCCYVAGEVCPFLEENTVPGRRWACGLFRELGNWDAVHADPRYLEHVQPAWDQIGIEGYSCGDWGIAENQLFKQCCFAEMDVEVT